MSDQFVQGTGIQSVGSVSSVGKQFVNPVMPGSLIVVGTVNSDNSKIPTGSGVTTSQGDTFVRDSNGNADPTSTGVAIYGCQSARGGVCTVTFTPTAADFISIGISEFKAMVRTGGLDTQNTIGAAGAGTTIVTGNLVTNGKDVIVAVCSHGGSGTISITEDGTYTLVFENENTANMPINFCYKIVDKGTYTGSWTTGSAVQRAASAAAYKTITGEISQSTTLVRFDNKRTSRPAVFKPGWGR